MRPEALVETELQGRGIGRKLMEAALRHPRLAGARRIFLQVWEENERALRLYEHLGFERLGTTRFTVGTEVIDDLVMVLDRSDAPLAEERAVRDQRRSSTTST